METEFKLVILSAALYHFSEWIEENAIGLTDMIVPIAFNVDWIVQ